MRTSIDLRKAKAAVFSSIEFAPAVGENPENKPIVIVGTCVKSVTEAYPVNRAEGQ